MKSKYGLSCHWCLCEVCTRIGCPKFTRRYKLDFCLRMLELDRCPVIKCDWFRHKEKHKVYRIVKREKKRDILLEKITSLEEKLADVLEKL